MNLPDCIDIHILCEDCSAWEEEERELAGWTVTVMTPEDDDEKQIYSWLAGIHGGSRECECGWIGGDKSEHYGSSGWAGVKRL